MPTWTIPRTSGSSRHGRRNTAPTRCRILLPLGGYDAMAAIAHVVKTLNGKIEADKAVAALKGWTFNSPRGPIMIDPDTRDIVMDEYLSEVVMGGNGKLHQKVIGKIERVKDPCKDQKIGP